MGTIHAPKTLIVKIAFVTETFPPEVNGVAMTIGHLVQELVARGHSITVVRPRRTDLVTPVFEYSFSEVLVPGLPIPRLSSASVGPPCRRHAAPALASGSA